jgi:hypothetical protein
MKHKYSVIRKVPYRIPGTKRLVWANVVSENQGLSLLLVPKSQTDGAHSLVLAEENVFERVFECVGPHTFELETGDIIRIGKTLRALGESLWATDLLHQLEADDL